MSSSSRTRQLGYVSSLSLSSSPSTSPSPFGAVPRRGSESASSSSDTNGRRRRRPTTELPPHLALNTVVERILIFNSGWVCHDESATIEEQAEHVLYYYNCDGKMKRARSSWEKKDVPIRPAVPLASSNSIGDDDVDTTLGTLATLFSWTPNCFLTVEDDCKGDIMDDNVKRNSCYPARQSSAVSSNITNNTEGFEERKRDIDRQHDIALEAVQFSGFCRGLMGFVSSFRHEQSSYGKDKNSADEKGNKGIDPLETIEPRIGEVHLSKSTIVFVKLEEKQDDENIRSTKEGYSSNVLAVVQFRRSAGAGIWRRGRSQTRENSNNARKGLFHPIGGARPGNRKGSLSPPPPPRLRKGSLTPPRNPPRENNGVASSTRVSSAMGSFGSTGGGAGLTLDGCTSSGGDGANPEAVRRAVRRYYKDFSLFHGGGILRSLALHGKRIRSGDDVDGSCEGMEMLACVRKNLRKIKMELDSIKCDHNDNSGRTLGNGFNDVVESPDLRDGQSTCSSCSRRVEELRRCVLETNGELRQLIPKLPIVSLRDDLKRHYDCFLVDLARRSADHHLLYDGGGCKATGGCLRAVVELVPPPSPPPSLPCSPARPWELLSSSAKAGSARGEPLEGFRRLGPSASRNTEDIAMMLGPKVGGILGAGRIVSALLRTFEHRGLLGASIFQRGQLLWSTSSTWSYSARAENADSTSTSRQEGRNQRRRSKDGNLTLSVEEDCIPRKAATAIFQYLRSKSGGFDCDRGNDGDPGSGPLPTPVATDNKISAKDIFFGSPVTKFSGRVEAEMGEAAACSSKPSPSKMGAKVTYMAPPSFLSTISGLDDWVQTVDAVTVPPYGTVWIPRVYLPPSSFTAEWRQEREQGELQEEEDGTKNDSESCDGIENKDEGPRRVVACEIGPGAGSVETDGIPTQFALVLYLSEEHLCSGRKDKHIPPLKSEMVPLQTANELPSLEIDLPRTSNLLASMAESLSMGFGQLFVTFPGERGGRGRGEKRNGGVSSGGAFNVKRWLHTEAGLDVIFVDRDRVTSILTATRRGSVDPRHELSKNMPVDVSMAMDDVFCEIRSGKEHSVGFARDQDRDGVKEVSTLLPRCWVLGRSWGGRELYMLLDSNKFVTITDVEKCICGVYEELSMHLL